MLPLTLQTVCMLTQPSLDHSGRKAREATISRQLRVPPMDEEVLGYASLG